MVEKLGRRRNWMADSSEGPHAVSASVVVGRKGNFTSIAMYGRNRLSAAHARGTRRGSRTQRHRSLQRNQSLVRPRKRRGRP